MHPESINEDDKPVSHKRLPRRLIIVFLAPFVFLIVGLYLTKSPKPSTIAVLPAATEQPTKSALAATPSLIASDYSYPPAEEPPSTALGGEGGAATQVPLPDTGKGVLPTLSPLAPQWRGLITNGDRSEQKVALTFDVGEREGEPAGYDEEIIKVLVDKQVPATFFLGGLWMIHNQKSTKELANNPLFELGNHAWSHLDFAQITPEQMNREIALTQQAMWELLGWQTKLFRLPYGTYSEEALDVIADYGMFTIQWDVVSGDPDPNITAESMIPWVLGQVRPGSIIIMHANGRGWHTAEALPTIIEALQEQGYTFATVSELLELETAPNQP